MKALAKIHTLTGHEACWKHWAKGLSYYLNNLFDEDGLPKPFSKAPRLTVYKRELYDCAECINLCLLLRDRFPQLETNIGDSRSRNSEGLGQAAMAHSVPGGCTWVGTTSRCIVGGSRRCFALSRFICARHLRSEIRSQVRYQSDRASGRDVASPRFNASGLTLQRAFEPCAASQGNLTSYVANPSSARPSADDALDRAPWTGR